MKHNLLTLFLAVFGSSVIVAQPAPDFTITATDNLQHQLYNDYLNQGKTVVLEIMFTTCPPCNSIAPSVEVLNQEWGAGQNDVVFFCLSDKSFDDNVDVAGFEATHGLTYHGAGQDGGSLSAVAPYKSGTYGTFLGTPTFVVIAPDGTVNFNPRGSNQNATIDSIDAAIAATGAQMPVVQYSLGGQISKENGIPIPDVEVTMTAQVGPTYSNTNGAYQFLPVNAGSNVTITPEKNNNHRNGVSILDLILLQRHLLFVDTLDSPYKYFAADVNRSKSLNVTDLVLMQRMILFIDDEFLNNTSWRFIPSSFIFLNTSNPLSITPPASISYNNLSGDNFNGDFVAIKVGDISGNADPTSAANELQPEDGPVFALSLADRELQVGERLEVLMEANNIGDLLGFQLHFEVNPVALEIISVEAAKTSMESGWMYNDQYLSSGDLYLNWINDKTSSVDPAAGLIKLTLQAHQKGPLSDFLKLNTAASETQLYAQNSSGKICAHQVQLQFTNLTTATKQVEAPNFFKAYPNPTENLVTLDFAETITPTDRLELWNCFGKQLAIFQQNTSDSPLNTQQLNLTGYPSGVYFLRWHRESRPLQMIQLVKM